VDSTHQVLHETAAGTKLLSIIGGLIFVSVSENKVVKNRVHLDLMPVERDQEAELNRLLGLGATIVDDRRTLRPGGWVVLADPEGNEFCLE
jgi:predicted enzyme related to lactoylglutathione lyase